MPDIKTSIPFLDTEVVICKTLFQMIKPIIFVKTVIPCDMFKPKRFLRNSCSKDFRINVSGGVHLQKRCRSQVLNFTKDSLRRVVPQLISKNFLYLYCPIPCFHNANDYV